MDELSLRSAAQQVLRRSGPLTPPQLRRQLGQLDGVDPDALPSSQELWHLLLDEPEDGFCAFPVADGQLCDLEHLLEGLTLTHPLTEEERGSGRLALEVDIHPVEILIDHAMQLPLVDGHVAELTHDHLAGPDGWLPEAAVLVVEVADGRIAVRGIDEIPAVEQRTADRLAEVYDRLREEARGVDVVELVLEARARYPRILREPNAPLRDVLAAGGLRVVADQVLAADEPDPEPYDPFRPIELHLRDDHELDDEEVDDVRLVHDAVAALLDRFTAALHRHLDGSPGEVPDPETLFAEMDLAAVLTGSGGGEDDDPDLAGDATGGRVVDFAGLPSAMARLLDDEELAFVLLEDVVAGSVLRAIVMRQLSEAMESLLRDRRARANAVWLRAGTLELTADDHAAAEPLLRRALELDPNHLEATIGLAGALNDRGKAGAALAHLRRVEGPGLAGTREMLTRYAAAGPAAAGRNDPCPCGSGRKYKVCCQRSNGWPLQERLEWVWHKIVRFATSPLGEEVVTGVAHAAGLDATLAAALDDVAIVNLALFEGGVLEDLCDFRGSLLPADELELLRDWSLVTASLQEVVEVAAGQQLTLLDLTGGARTTVVDTSLSRSVEVGDALLVWPVSTPAGIVPANGVVRVPDHRRQDLLALLDDAPDADDLARWYASLSAPPGLANTDGDPLQLITVVYRVDDPEAAWTALAEHLEEDGPGLLAFAERDGRRWLTGSITREGDELTVEVNSATRAAWFADLIERVVPSAVLVDEERQSVHDLLDGSDELEGDEGRFDLGALDPEARSAIEAQLEQLMTEHEDAWVDTPVGALDGATPREAVDDPTRRQALLRLLEEFEAHAGRWDSPGRPMDADRLRQLLGL